MFPNPDNIRTYRSAFPCVRCRRALLSCSSCLCLTLLRGRFARYHNELLWKWMALIARDPTVLVPHLTLRGQKIAPDVLELSDAVRAKWCPIHTAP